MQQGNSTTERSLQGPVPATGHPSGQPEPRSRGDLGLWWGRSACTAAWQDVDWTGLRVTPGILFWLLIMPLLVAIGANRLYYDGEVAFYAPALLFGWPGTLVMAWASWLLVPVPRAPEAAGPPTALHLLAMLLAQSLMLQASAALVGLVIAQGLPIEPQKLRVEVYRYAFWFLSIWTVAAQLQLVWRVVGASALRRSLAATVMLASSAAHLLVDRPPFWVGPQPPVTQSAAGWIAPLADPDTLVMTAADADHTSLGCGRRSELTFFGRAMFAEALQTTWSFEQAHAAARTVIDQRSLQQ